MGRARRQREDLRAAAQRVAEERARRVVGSGVRVEAVGKYHVSPSVLEPAAAGEHLWSILGVWRVADPSLADGQVMLDTENLLTLEGPGCFHCEQPWSPALAEQACRPV
jgi:isoaspartyl peptidase/L-asparaginase-like protein (Ntn-hydrolase superfamily)